MARAQPAKRSPRRGLLCAAGLALALLSACAYVPPRPPTGPTPADALIAVPYPPPPAHVEVIPPRKVETEVWVGGQWDWDGEAWKWTPGAWITPPANAYFTRWTTVRRSDGQLFFARAAWRDRQGRPLDVAGDECPPVPPARPTRPAAEVAKR